jgi:hypothetical protein
VACGIKLAELLQGGDGKQVDGAQIEEGAAGDEPDLSCEGAGELFAAILSFGGDNLAIRKGRQS